MKKTLLSIALIFASSSAFAEFSDGTADYLFAHDHFSMVNIKGDAAQKMYERLQTEEKEDVNGLGQKMGSLSKISADGKMWCQKASQGTYKCQINFDSTSGGIHSTWSK